MDPLRRNDLDRAAKATPEEKAGQALEMMAFGIELQRQKLRRAHPSATEAEVESLLRTWLARDT